MKLPKSLALAFCVGLVLLATSTRADEWDQKTKVTFSGAVQVAKTTLPAGTYIFKLMNTSDRHVVQIFNEDETHLITTVMTTPDFRLQPTDKTVVKFSESGAESDASGTLPEGGVPIKAWFYPGEEFGHDFKVVKHARTEAAAQPPAVTESPAVTPEAPPAAPEPPAPVETAPAAPEAAAPVTPAAPEPPAAQPQTQETQPAPAAPEPQSEPSQLPQTASQLPLVGLIGLISLGVAAGFRSLCNSDGANRH